MRDFLETFERQRQRQKSDLDSIRNSCDVFFNQEPKLETSAKACKEEDDHNY